MRPRTHLQRLVSRRRAPARRGLGLAALVAAAALALAACGSSNRPHVASLPANNARASTTGAATSSTRAKTKTKSANGNPTALVDEWATCMQSHGDPNQADPIIDAHGVINIVMPPAASPASAGGAHGVAGTCSQYLAAAQRALRAADPVAPPPDQAGLLKYVNCMRANGVPNYPYPTGSTTNFNGTGVDPNSPFVIKISEECGSKLHLPLWWSAGWGPPGDVSVGPAPGGPRPGALVPATGAANGGTPRGPAVSGANAHASASG
jgi:hypothetical protein